MRNKALNMHEFATRVADDTGEPLSVVERVLWSGFDTIARCLAAHEEITVSNFGTFRPADVPAREARNPQTGGRVTVPQKYVPRFKPTGRLKTMVAEGQATETIRKPRSGWASS